MQYIAFPYIVSAETILFLNLKIVPNSNSCHNISIFYLLNKLNFCCGNYSREGTIQGRKLYEEIL